MGKLRAKVQFLKSLTLERLELDVLKIVADHKEIVVDLNTGQLMRGANSKDKSLGEYKNKEYAEFKRELNPAGVVDLNLTGDFHNSFFLDVDKFPVRIDASDIKTVDLVERYGEDIFGLTDESKEILNKQYLKEAILQHLRKIL